MKKLILILFIFFISIGQDEFGGFPVFTMPKGLVGEFTNKPPGRNSDVTKWEARSGLELTGVSSPVINSDGSRTFDGSNDYFYQKELDDETGSSAIYYSNATLKGLWPVDVDLSGTVSMGDIIRVGDGSKYAHGSISAFGGGLTVSNTWTSDFSVDEDGTTANNGVATGNIDGIDGEDDNLRLTIDTNSGSHFLEKNSVFTDANMFRLRYDYYIPSGQSNIDGVRAQGGNSYLHSIETTTDAWTNVDIYATNSGGIQVRFFAHDGATASFQDAGGDDVFYLKDIIIDKITDIPATAIKVSSWTAETSFNPNSIATLEILDSDYSLTGDHSITVRIKPDDGQPASDQVIVGKTDITNSRIGYAIILTSTGKIKIQASNDGATDDYFITDAAVFSDGAQSNYVDVGYIYDASEANIDIIIDGAEVASTETNDVSITIFDTPAMFMIGRSEDGYLYDGNIKNCLVFNQALSLREMYRLHRR